MWVARNINGTLTLFQNEPEKVNGYWKSEGLKQCIDPAFYLEEVKAGECESLHIFAPQVTDFSLYENSSFKEGIESMKEFREKLLNDPELAKDFLRNVYRED